ncbi:hypothetical protein HPB49_020317 [Dermacentor silvarum]|uniref:Uncharacterized protein n=1 Tax=Dermacentor silvarum TaxID=543639 RepID=A0ACB8E2D3_DERSI|nr:hypothetical protein HPB49_020317 [Dermacentor silvarum]
MLKSTETQLTITQQPANEFATAFAPPPPTERPAAVAIELPRHNKAELLAPFRYFPTRAIVEEIEALCSVDFRLSELRMVLDTRRRRSTPGADGLTFQTLRNIDAAQIPSLMQEFNHVWRTGCVPASWREAVVVPLLKSGKPAGCIGSYRPVSLTSVAGKTLEAMALRRLEWIATALDTFAPEQSGFRRLGSTADSLSATLEESLSRHEAGYLILLDVQSAFDGLPHATIIGSLRELGVTGRLLQYISCFLTNRTLRVRVGGALSDPRGVFSGVPQGSVLSYFLFNLALSRLPDFIPRTTSLAVRLAIYADDIAIFACGPTEVGYLVRASIQTAVDAVDKYLASIGLQLSTAKTEVLMVHPRAACARFEVTLWTASIPVHDASDITTTVGDAQDHVFIYGRRALITRPDQPD